LPLDLVDFGLEMVVMQTVCYGIGDEVEKRYEH